MVTIGALQAGTKENVIPDEAIIKLNVRTFDEGVRKRVLAAIERIVNAEAAASGAPKQPEITPLDRYSLVTNDPEATKRVGRSVSAALSCRSRAGNQADDGERGLRSFGAEWRRPSVFWFVGGTDPDVYAKAKKDGQARRASRPITTRVSRRSFIRPWRPASRRWWSPRKPGCRHKRQMSRQRDIS